jgi:hypothetical protein
MSQKSRYGVLLGERTIANTPGGVDPAVRR